MCIHLVTKLDELWFASDFHPGFMGLDLFVTRQDQSNVAESGNSGYFSSNRPGGTGEDDIYRFDKLAVSSEQFAKNDTSEQSPVTIHGSQETPLELNKVDTLENIFYDFDNWDIRDDTKPALDRRVQPPSFPETRRVGRHVHHWPGN